MFQIRRELVSDSCCSETPCTVSDKSCSDDSKTCSDNAECVKTQTCDGQTCSIDGGGCLGTCPKLAQGQCVINNVSYILFSLCNISNSKNIVRM